MEDLQLIPKIFEFSEAERARISLSDPTKVRISAEDQVAMLRRVEPGVGRWDDAPLYPTDEDLYLKTWLTVPAKVSSWRSFDCWADLPEGTSIGFRLSADGTAQLYWDGAAWSAAANGHWSGTTWIEGQWSTVQEVHDHIAEFSAAAKAIQVIVNLRTEDPAVSPTVSAVAVLYEALIDQEYDLVYESLIDYLQAIRPLKEWIFRLDDDSASIALLPDSAYNVGTFDLVDVLEAFDHTADPDHLVSIKKSFTAGSKVLEFTAEVPAGNEVWIKFSHRPNVAVMTNQDYGLAKIPAIVIEGVDELQGARFPGGVAFRDRAAKTALLVRGPYRCTLRCTLRLIADRGRDIATMLSKLMGKLTAEPLLPALGTDERFSVQVQKGLGDFGLPNLSDLNYKRVIIDILDVGYWVVGTRTVSLVTEGLKASGDLSFRSGTAQRPS